jgi:hypothetical protein
MLVLLCENPAFSDVVPSPNQAAIQLPAEALSNYCLYESNVYSEGTIICTGKFVALYCNKSDDKHAKGWWHYDTVTKACGAP